MSLQGFCNGYRFCVPECRSNYLYTGCFYLIPLYFYTTEKIAFTNFFNGNISLTLSVLILFISQLSVYISLIISCLFVMYDTQLIVEKKRLGDNDYIWSVNLLLLIITLYQSHIFIVLSVKFFYLHVLSSLWSLSIHVFVKQTLFSGTPLICSLTSSSFSKI